MTQHDALYDAVVNGEAKAAGDLTREALAANRDPMDIVTGSLAPAMEEVGRRFQCEEYYVPELLLSARAMKAAMTIIQPLLAKRGAEPVGRVVIGTVKGDLHDIGKNLVASMLEGSGFEVIDLGADVTPAAFATAVKEKNAHIVCLSALLTVTMRSMQTTIDALKEAGVRERVKVLVGGAPLSEAFARQIGADGYAADAPGAAALARTVLQKRASS